MIQILSNITVITNLLPYLSHRNSIWKSLSKKPSNTKTPWKSLVVSWRTWNAKVRRSFSQYLKYTTMSSTRRCKWCIIIKGILHQSRKTFKHVIIKALSKIISQHMARSDINTLNRIILISLQMYLWAVKRRIFKLTASYRIIIMHITKVNHH